MQSSSNPQTLKEELCSIYKSKVYKVFDLIILDMKSCLKSGSYEYSLWSQYDGSYNTYYYYNNLTINEKEELRLKLEQNGISVTTITTQHFTDVKVRKPITVKKFLWLKKTIYDTEIIKAPSYSTSVITFKFNCNCEKV